VLWKSKKGQGIAPRGEVSIGEKSQDWIEEQAIQSLRQEASDLFNAGRSALMSADRTLAIAATLAVAAATIGLEKKYPVVFLLLPLVLMAISIYQIQVFSDCIVMGAYRRQLESDLQVRLRLDAPVISYESTMADLRGTSLARIVLIGIQLLYAMVVLGLVLYGGIVAASLKPRVLAAMPLWPFGLYSAVSLVAFAILGVAFIEMRRLDRRVRDKIQTGSV
jgi:type IV secretory pathway TrbD component